MKQNNRLILWCLMPALAAGHGLHDFVASWLVTRYVAAPGLIDIVLAVLLFNLLAFALQPLWGWLTDRFGGYCPAACAGLIGALLAVWLPIGLAALVLHGVASALFHVGAGGWLARVSSRPLTLGVFAAPGVMGGMLGVASAVYGWPVALPVSLLLLVVLALSLYCRGETSPAATVAQAGRGGRWVWLAVGFPLLLIAVKSAAWLPIHQQAMDNMQVLLLVGLVAGCGKLFGALACQIVGTWRWIAIALTGTLLAWSVTGQGVLPGWGGLLLLQSALVPLWYATNRALPGRSGLSAGLCLGFAFALGGVPMVFGLEISQWWCVALAVLLLAAAWLAMRIIPRRVKFA